MVFPGQDRIYKAGLRTVPFLPWGDTLTRLWPPTTIASRSVAARDINKPAIGVDIFHYGGVLGPAPSAAQNDILPGAGRQFSFDSGLTFYDLGGAFGMQFARRKQRLYLHRFAFMNRVRCFDSVFNNNPAGQLSGFYRADRLQQHIRCLCGDYIRIRIPLRSLASAFRISVGTVTFGRYGLEAESSDAINNLRVSSAFLSRPIFPRAASEMAGCLWAAILYKLFPAEAFEIIHVICKPVSGPVHIFTAFANHRFDQVRAGL